jgi:hypothetical protein
MGWISTMDDISIFLEITAGIGLSALVLYLFVKLCEKLFLNRD